MAYNNTKRISPVNINAALRKQEEFKLRLAGMTYRDIRDAMLARYGRDTLPPTYDERYVWRDIQNEMRKARTVTTGLASDLRELESQRLDELQMAIYPKALSGDLKAVNALLRIFDHRAKLFGLYAPSQVKVHDWRSEILELIQSGVITREQAEEEIGPELTQQLLDAGGNGAIEGRFTEAEASEDSETGLDGQVA